MLEDAEMAKGFWPEAHKYANYVRNRSPTKALTRTTPNEAFYGKKPSVATLQIFGSRCHVRVPPEQRRKLDAHSIDGILCAFECASKAYKVWIPSKHKFVASRDVIVYKQVFSQRDDDPIPHNTPSKGVSQPTPSTALIEGVTEGNTNQTTTNQYMSQNVERIPLPHLRNLTHWQLNLPPPYLSQKQLQLLYPIQHQVHPTDWNVSLDPPGKRKLSRSKRLKKLR